MERVNASRRPPASKFRRLAITPALMMGGDAALGVALSLLITLFATASGIGFLLLRFRGARAVLQGGLK